MLTYADVYVASRLQQYSQILGLQRVTRRPGALEETVPDVFDGHVLRRLEAEAHLLKLLESAGHVCGFLFVQEPYILEGGARLKPNARDVREGEGGAGKWNLKWCELQGMDLKMFVFNRERNERLEAEDEAVHGTFALRPLCTLVRTLLPGT
jgi:hypothetical protein